MAYLLILPVFGKLHSLFNSSGPDKFLLDENGKLVAHFKSTVKPMSEEIISKL